MSISSSNFIGRCFELGPSGQPTLDVGAFAERILLFDRYVLESARLLEIPALVAAVGSNGLSKLIESKGLQIYSDAFALGEGAIANGEAPPEAYKLVAVRVRDLKDARSGWLQPIMNIPGLSYREARDLKSLIGRSALAAPAEAGVAALKGTRGDLLGNKDMLRSAVALAAAEFARWSVKPEDVQLEVQEVGQDAYTVESNLANLPGAPADRVREITQHALLGVLGVNHQLEWMQAFSAMPGFRANETPLLQAKLAGVAQQVTGQQRASLGRVLSAAGLPDFDAAARSGEINFNALLEIRDSDEARAFREWLSRADALSDADLGKLVGGLGGRVARAVNSPTGRIVRVLVGTAATLPLANPALSAGASIAIGLLDSFVWDKILPKPGAWSFVDDKLRSVFGKD